MQYGFAGSVLRVDLTRGSIEKHPLSDELARNWLGARGIVARTLWEEVPLDADPLGPENRFVVATGVMTGHFVPAGSKCGFGAISPATNSHHDASMGGHFGPELKAAGYDYIVIQGISPKPVYLFIEDDQVELRPADTVWGLGSIDTEARLKNELGESFQIATIGPAGENQVHFACISHDFGRQAGRGGLGAVMGSKKLKAIAVRGTHAIPVKELDVLKEGTKAVIQRTKTHPNMAPWQRYGTSMFVGWANERGCYPTRNFQSSYFEGWEKVDGPVLKEELWVNDKACFGCWMNCGKYSRTTKEGRYDAFVEGPEYETTALCGGSCGIGDLRDVAYANYLCDNLGLDTISGGSTVAFAMECFQRGILTSADLDGREIQFGSIDDFEYLVRKIATREGIGALLADGTRQAAMKLGGDALKYAIQVKGLEHSGYESRSLPANLLGFMTADIGAHHNRSWAVTVDLELGRDNISGKAKHVVYLQHIRPLWDILSICRLFYGEIDVLLEDTTASLRAITGWDISEEEQLRIAERVFNLTRAIFLLRNGGPGRQHDIPSRRHWEDPVPTGPEAGKHLTREAIDLLLDEYYQARGWDGDGHPRREVLEDLGLADVADRLEAVGLLGKTMPWPVPSTRGEMMKPAAM
ncbi:MAG: aldehyde ferredoxin oxidoreductase family protein [Bradymonadales bacterium]|nr:aldehyde ferredoxin oxidoreductase family protein [Bradymonadales bacterium]